MKILWCGCLSASGRANGFGLALALSLAVNLQSAETGRVFATPEAACAALASAVSATNHEELRAIFGPAAAEFVNPDRVQAANEFSAFAAALKEGQRLVSGSETRRVLEIGHDAWPFPIPIVQQDGHWMFDTSAGIEELLSRRIGQDELETLNVMRAYVEAQREYASRDHNGDEVLEFAQKLISSPDKKDGLYWSPDLDGELSPFGPLVAHAQVQGYGMKPKDEKEEPEPFHGYFFKILKRQGRHTPAGKYDYVINGHMIAGFALVAWPAQYGQTGIMTFVVNQQGRVYQKDLGPKTTSLASAMKQYDPDSTWQLSKD